MKYVLVFKKDPHPWQNCLDPRISIGGLVFNCKVCIPPNSGHLRLVRLGICHARSECNVDGRQCVVVTLSDR